MVIVQITSQQGCELQKRPQKHNVQDMIKILPNVENVQCLIFGRTYLTFLLENNRNLVIMRTETITNARKAK